MANDISAPRRVDRRTNAGLILGLLALMFLAIEPPPASAKPAQAAGKKAQPKAKVPRAKAMPKVKVAGVPVTRTMATIASEAPPASVGSCLAPGKLCDHNGACCSGICKVGNFELLPNCQSGRGVQSGGQDQAAVDAASLRCLQRTAQYEEPCMEWCHTTVQSALNDCVAACHGVGACEDGCSGKCGIKGCEDGCNGMPNTPVPQPPKVERDYHYGQRNN